MKKNIKLIAILIIFIPLIIYKCNLNSKIPNKESTSTQTIDIDEEIENKKEVHSFINSIKTKDCISFRKRLKHDYVYIISEVTYVFDFTRENDFHFDKLKKISICDFLFNQDTLNIFLKKYEEELYLNYNVYTLTEIAQNTDTIVVHLHYDDNTKKNQVSIGLLTPAQGGKYPMFDLLFNCETKSFSTCYLIESNSEIIHK
ncbi:hypothetical protein EHQ24_00065 [Leptospira noumeaensis]|uniref:Uncharacterized protein n=1 Tax=Leptospira noumeaensis TaxID=2484964 RepID=A0A4R9IJA2_9LEPT|nr:hypothetical protein [Leptospira noumeaensis]TGK89258.1 hypothetical protein EHQ24_00065 [Leptospira noumeaensis]